MPLVKQSGVDDDPFTYVPEGAELPDQGAIIVHLSDWLDKREQLLARGTPLGVRLKSDESPESIADDLERLDVVALEFPAFRDGRAYTHARMLRERLGYEGEVRAVGDVLMEQLHFMQRAGFDAFELDADDPVAQLEIANRDFSVWYQPTGDGRPTALQLRHRR